MTFTDDEIKILEKQIENNPGWQQIYKDRALALLARLKAAEKALNLFNETLCCGNVLGDTDDLNDLLDDWRAASEK